MQNNEIWKPVLGYEGLYEVSSLGRVRSIGHYIYHKHTTSWHSGRVLHPTRNCKSGYCSVMLSKDSKCKRVYVHRLVATSFLGQHERMEVNHKDENKANNCLDNLEWCDRVYNVNYGTGEQRKIESARRNKRGRFPKYIAQYSLDGKHIATYSSSEDAARAIGKPKSGSSLRLCARHEGGVKQALGYRWEYVDL